MAFQGFGPKALPFLKALGFHQNKEWFEANRATYEDDLHTPVGELVEDLSAAFTKAKIPLRGDRKTSVFRIHRDVRFAKDKSPYKTNVGAVLTRGGGKNDPDCFTFTSPSTAVSPRQASTTSSRINWRASAPRSC